MSAKVFGGVAVAVGAIAVGGYVGVTSVANNKIDREVQDFLEEEELQDVVTYGSVKSNLIQQSVEFRDLEIVGDAGEVVSVDLLQMRDFDRQNDPPQFATVEARGMRMELEETPNPIVTQTLQQLGYDDLAADVTLSYEADPEQKTFNVSIDHRIPKMGSFSGRLQLSNVVLPEAGEVDGTVWLAENTGAELVEASLTYDDDSLLPRLVDYFAEQQGMSADAFKQQLTAGIPLATQFLPDSPIARQVSAELQEFIQTPDRLSIFVSPDRPVGLMRLSTVPPATLPELLGVAVSAN
ncbi:hypothetical protein [Synechococcus sp. PCC 7336]|uniref:hypothetical protein n=1 Tax=Synechococcus sp. PCC 7336 TaxID=195250 RepID=UPI00034AE289|nr:hypothetical protein [Synechococcus sp. PCC 7336]